MVNTYPVVAVDGAREPELADDFVELVVGATGRRILADAGFGAP